MKGWTLPTFRSEAERLVWDVRWLRQLQRGVYQQLQLRGQWRWGGALHPCQPAYHQEQWPGLHLPRWQGWNGSVHPNIFMASFIKFSQESKTHLFDCVDPGIHIFTHSQCKSLTADSSSYSKMPQHINHIFLVFMKLKKSETTTRKFSCYFISGLGALLTAGI